MKIHKIEKITPFWDFLEEKVPLKKSHKKRYLKWLDDELYPSEKSETYCIVRRIKQDKV